MTNVDIHPLVSPWGRFGLYSFFIDAPEPAIVDTGIATSPAEGMLPALEAIGRRIEDVRWILLTHGHVDHLGGAHALWELTGRRARVVIHEADAPFLRARRAHVDEYLEGADSTFTTHEGEQKQIATAQAAISGELEPTVLVTGGETLSLGGDVTVSVHAIPGHTAGSVAYVVDGQNAVFVGDGVQVHGAANAFPSYVDPVAYRSSLRYLRDEIRPRNLYLGHPYRNAEGVPYGVELDADTGAGGTAAEPRHRSPYRRRRVAPARAMACRRSDSPYSPFAEVAEELGYHGDPSLEPSPFFTTMHGYRTRFSRESAHTTGSVSA